jgi:hypothetical protein
VDSKFYRAGMPSTPPEPVAVHPPLTDLSDVDLVADVADEVRVPRDDPADSFVLHAPLELAARAALLPRVPQPAREGARARIAEIAAEYRAFGPAVDDPAPRTFDSPASGAAALASAIDAGDLDAVDAAAAALTRLATGPELRTLLAGVVVARLSAAAHAPIFLYQLPRVAPRGELPGELLRPLVREVARHPNWRLTWHERTVRRRRRSPDALRAAIAATPRLGVPGSEFIHPVMSQAERGGMAADLLADATAGVDLAVGIPIVLRAAAWSMLVEPRDYIPYGWTHCLTMPQAVLGIADVLDARTALAVASTYVVGFRAAFAQRSLVETPPPDPEIDLTDAIDAGPDIAAAAAWNAPAPAMPRVVTELVTRAAVHHDAHYAKYTLACLDAAAADRSHTRLYLAAAAKLAGYWATTT